MAAMNAMGLPNTSPFGDANQIPLPDDLPIEVQTQDQSQNNDEEEKVDSPGMMELSQQIDSHVVVIDEENLTTTTPTKTGGAPP